MEKSVDFLKYICYNLLVLEPMDSMSFHDFRKEIL